jgi:hypothetical protein
MSKTLMRTLLALASVASTTVFAAAAAPTLDLAAVQKFRSQAQAQTARANAQAKNLGIGGYSAPGSRPAEAFVNVLRSYPTSCLDSPLPLGLWSNNPEAQQADIVLYGDALSSDPNERNFSETDTITVFRLPCAGGQSATLLEIDRPNCGSTCGQLYPTLPGVTLTQGSTQNYPIRYADDPNTFYANNFANSPLYGSDVYVLENFYGNNLPFFNYNEAFTLTIDDFATSLNLTNYSFAAYNPSDYAETSQPLPISGHMTTNWASANQSGEGIVMQIYDNGDSATRTLAFAWFTYDDLGVPFWLFGQASFPIGARTVTAATAYYVGGSFAPSSPSAAVPPTTWGSATFTFPDCTHMTVQYNGNASAHQGPTGSGTRQFLRVGYVNGLVCI